MVYKTHLGENMIIKRIIMGTLAFVFTFMFFGIIFVGQTPKDYVIGGILLQPALMFLTIVLSLSMGFNYAFPEIVERINSMLVRFFGVGGRVEP